jgi:hypothetical protein
LLSNGLTVVENVRQPGKPSVGRIFIVVAQQEAERAGEPAGCADDVIKRSSTSNK